MNYIAERRQEEKDRRRSDILDAAEAVAATIGIEALTMDQVARRARISRALLYVYFHDKSDLHFALCERALALLLTSRWLKDVDGRLRTFVTMTTVAALLLAAGALAGNLALPANPRAWLGLGLLMLFYGTAFTSLFVLLPRLDAMNNSAALNFEPIAVLFLAWPILGQGVGPLQIIGALSVVGAVVALGSAKH